MNRRLVLELSGLAAGVVMSGTVRAAAPPKRLPGPRVMTRDGVGLHVSDCATNPTGLDLQIFETLRSAWRKDFPQWIDENTDPFFTPTTSPGNEALAGPDDEPDPAASGHYVQSQLGGDRFPGGTADYQDSPLKA